MSSRVFYFAKSAFINFDEFAFLALLALYRCFKLCVFTIVFFLCVICFCLLFTWFERFNVFLLGWSVTHCQLWICQLSEMLRLVLRRSFQNTKRICVHIENTIIFIFLPVLSTFYEHTICREASYDPCCFCANMYVINICNQ